MKKLLICLSVIVALAGCSNDNNDENAPDVSGTWRGAVTFQSCSPADVCTATGFTQGSTLNAVLVLSQGSPNRSELDGNYTYEGSGITADVEGSVGGNQLVVDGGATNILGTITVHLAGNISTNVMNATVTHQINLVDGRSGNVTGSGTLSR
ncbi:MAG TPA: hypothetical protein VH815_14535 [Acidobacteriota bacterium]|jgi:hypothetical protein